uniref:Uncharacterized protein n=1 Tax=Spongospora subterranea TaxID=70186 RepID=A0A0H5RTL2_9EUKA|eukprot:CRZ12079.1 hypothetical protein [Spongospora subterranea]
MKRSLKRWTPRHKLVVSPDPKPRCATSIATQTIARPPAVIAKNNNAPGWNELGDYIMDPDIDCLVSIAQENMRLQTSMDSMCHDLKNQYESQITSLQNDSADKGRQILNLKKTVVSRDEEICTLLDIVSQLEHRKGMQTDTKKDEKDRELAELSRFSADQNREITRLGEVIDLRNQQIQLLEDHGRRLAKQLELARNASIASWLFDGSDS